MIDSFIFQFIGLFYLVVGFGIFINPGYFKKVMDAFMTNLAISYLGGIMALFLGYSLVYYHNIWKLDWTVIITIIGWLALAKGLALLLTPASFPKIFKTLERSKRYLLICASVFVVFGLILMYLGFSVVA
jgi:uncharacterized protein YjeT (DUF2065 family)